MTRLENLVTIYSTSHPCSSFLSHCLLQRMFVGFWTSESLHLIASDFNDELWQIGTAGGILDRIRKGAKLSQYSSLCGRIIRASDNSNNNDFSFITLKIVKNHLPISWAELIFLKHSGSKICEQLLFSIVGDRVSGSIHGHGQTPRGVGENERARGRDREGLCIFGVGGRVFSSKRSNWVVRVSIPMLCLFLLQFFPGTVRFSA